MGSMLLFKVAFVSSLDPTSLYNWSHLRLVGNQLHMEEPEMIPFSRYVINCFHGTPAKPKLPGQNTEHCEQTVDAWLGFTRFASKT